MPIKPENRHKYPPNWQELRMRVLARAGHCCELCFLRNGVYARRGPGGPIESEQLTRPDDPKGWTRIVLTIAHINQDPTDNRLVNLLALCQRCHLRIDAPYRAKPKEPQVQA
jgi:hypothetical protein